MNKNTAVGISCAVGAGSGIIAPFLIHTQYPLVPPVPLFIAAGVALLVGGLALLFIEGSKAFFTYLGARGS